MATPEDARDYQTDVFVRTTHPRFGEIDRGDYHLVFGRMFPSLMSMVVLGGILFLLSLVVYYADYSGILRYLLLAVAVTLLGGATAWFASTRSVDPTPLGQVDTVPEESTGDLARVARLLERGRQGMTFSQLQFVDRLRRAFLRKLRYRRSLTEEDVDALLADPAALEAVVGDGAITTFLLDAERARGRWSRIVRGREPVLRSTPAREAFFDRMKVLVARMEAWE